MAGQDEDAFALIASGQIVFEPLVADKTLRHALGVARHLAELGQQPAQIAVELSYNLPPLSCRLLGKSEAKIKIAGAAQTRGEQQGDAADERADVPGHAPR